MNAAGRAALARSFTAGPKTDAPCLLTPPVAAWSEADGYAAVDARSGGRCECWGLWAEGCERTATVHHHIAGRVGPDPHHPDNLLHLTDECHRLIHASPAQSMRDGTMRSRLAVSPRKDTD